MILLLFDEAEENFLSPTYFLECFVLSLSLSLSLSLCLSLSLSHSMISLMGNDLNSVNIIGAHVKYEYGPGSDGCIQQYFVLSSGDFSVSFQSSAHESQPHSLQGGPR